MTASPSSSESVQEITLKSSIDVIRKEALEDVPKQLTNADRFVALLGHNGSGKSHFVEHQLIPQLRSRVDNENNKEDWRIITVSPLANPIGLLALELAAPGILLPSGRVKPFYRNEIEAELRSGNDGLTKVFETATSSHDSSYRLLIVIDQLEELFRYKELLRNEVDDGENDHYALLRQFFRKGDDILFFNLLLQAIQSPNRIHVLFTVGIETISSLNNYQGWPELISRNRYTLKDITAAEVKHALFDKEQDHTPDIRALYSKIVADYNEHKGEVDLLCRINLALWLLRQPAGITNSDSERSSEGQRSSPDTTYLDRYLSFKGLTMVYDAAADQVYNRLSEKEQLACRRLFQAITLKDPLPGKIAIKAPEVLENLISVCTRDESEIKELIEQYPEREMLAVNGGDEMDKNPDTEDLLSVIDQFQLTGEDEEVAFSPFLRLSNLAGLKGSYLKGAKDNVINIGGFSLIQSWKHLAVWVEEEDRHGIIYKKLVQDAMLYYQDQEQTSHQEVSALTGFIDHKVSILKQLWESIRLYIQVINPDEVSEDDSLNKTNQDRGLIELARDWLNHTIPNEKWSQRYLPLRITKPDTNVSPAFELTLDSVDHNSFKLMKRFLSEKKILLDRQIENETIKANEARRRAKRFARVVVTLLFMAIVAGIIGYVQKRNADINANNLKLLGFVDSMAKTHVIPRNTYLAPAFARLKMAIEKSNDIQTNDDVIDFLQENDILHFKPDDTERRGHTYLSKRALRQLDFMVNQFYYKDKQFFLATSDSVLTTAKMALEYNESTTDKYQFPYLYQVLEENTGLLRIYINRLSQQADKKAITENRLHNYFHAVDSQVAATDANPHPDFTNQFAVGDASGQVTVFVGKQEIDLGNRIRSGISDLRYSKSGNSLYVSTFSGELFRYFPLTSQLQPTSPVAFAPELNMTQLSVRWNIQKKQNPIISIHRTSKADHLLVRGDIGVSLIRRVGTDDTKGNFVEVDYVELLDGYGNGKMLSLNAFAEDPTGRYFWAGGPEVSAFLELDAVGNRLKFKKPAYYDHAGVSVSSVAFDPERDGIAVALGSETGDLLYAPYDSFDELLSSAIRIRHERSGRSFQESGISKLKFNEPANRQLMAASIDGSIWIINLEQVNGIYAERNAQLDGAVWDHLKLEVEGRSVNDLTRVNNNTLLSVEHNSLRLWPTNIEPLMHELDSLLYLVRNFNP